MLVGGGRSKPSQELDSAWNTAATGAPTKPSSITLASHLPHIIIPRDTPIYSDHQSSKHLNTWLLIINHNHLYVSSSTHLSLSLLRLDNKHSIRHKASSPSTPHLHFIPPHPTRSPLALGLPFPCTPCHPSTSQLASSLTFSSRKPSLKPRLSQHYTTHQSFHLSRRH